MFLKNTRRSPTTNQQHFFCCSRADLQFPTGMEQCATFHGGKHWHCWASTNSSLASRYSFRTRTFDGFFGGATFSERTSLYQRWKMDLWYKWHFHFSNFAIFISYHPVVSLHAVSRGQVLDSPHTKLAANQPMAIAGCNMLVYTYKYKYIYIYVYIYIFSHLGVLKFRNAYPSILLIQFLFDHLRLESIFWGKQIQFHLFEDQHGFHFVVNFFS